MVSFDGGSASKVDDVTALPSRHKMADMCYYGNVMTTTRWWLCITILHLQQYSHRLNLFYLLFCLFTFLFNVLLASAEKNVSFHVVLLAGTESHSSIWLCFVVLHGTFTVGYYFEKISQIFSLMHTCLARIFQMNSLFM